MVDQFWLSPTVSRLTCLLILRVRRQLVSSPLCSNRNHGSRLALMIRTKADHRPATCSTFWTLQPSTRLRE